MLAALVRATGVFIARRVSLFPPMAKRPRMIRRCRNAISRRVVDQICEILSACTRGVCTRDQDMQVVRATSRVRRRRRVIHFSTSLAGNVIGVARSSAAQTRVTIALNPTHLAASLGSAPPGVVLCGLRAKMSAV